MRWRAALALVGLAAIAPIGGMIDWRAAAGWSAEGSALVQAGESGDPEMQLSKRCLSYSQRYGECKRIRGLPMEERRALFLSRNAKLAKQAVIIRAGDVDFHHEDVWLAACTLVIEATFTGERHAIFLVHVTNNSTNNVTDDFAPLVHRYFESDMKTIFSNDLYTSGYLNGDVVLAYWMEQHPFYDFLWDVEMDVRFVGNWGELFSYSTRFAQVQVGSSFGLKTKNPSARADAIVYSLFRPELLFNGRHPNFINKTNWWHLPYVWRGRLRRNYANIPKVGAWMMAFGMSSELAAQIIAEARLGSGSQMHETNLPMTAAYYKYKLVNVPLNKSFHCCIRTGQQVYSEWMKGHGNYSCLTDYLIHPVKSAAL